MLKSFSLCQGLGPVCSCFRAALGFRNPWAPEIRQEAAGFPGGLQVPVKSYPRILSESSMMGCVTILHVCGVSRPAGPGARGHRLAGSLTRICCSLLLSPGANSVPFFLCCLGSPLSPVLSPCPCQALDWQPPVCPPGACTALYPPNRTFLITVAQLVPSLPACSPCCILFEFIALNLFSVCSSIRM